MPSQHRPMSRRRLLAALALAPLAAVALRRGRSTAAEPIAEGAQALVQAFAGEGVLLL